MGQSVISCAPSSSTNKGPDVSSVPRQFLAGSVGRVSPHIEQVAIKCGAYRGLAVVLSVLFTLGQEQDGDDDISTDRKTEKADRPQVNRASLLYLTLGGKKKS